MDRGPDKLTAPGSRPPGGTSAAAAERRTRRHVRRRASATAIATLFTCVVVGCAGARASGAPYLSGRSLSEVLATLVWPLRFDSRGNVRSRYGYRAGGGGAGRYHYGLDLQARRGEPVYSAGEGFVAASGKGGAYGRYVRVDHGHGLSSFYAHLERALTREGERVRRGQVIGLAGASGNATGPHLHFELRWKDRWVDPLLVLPRLE